MKKRYILLLSLASLFAFVRIMLSRSKARTLRSYKKYPDDAVATVSHLDVTDDKVFYRTRHTLQRAFFTDPVFNYIMPDGERRFMFQKIFFSILLKSRPTRVYSTGKNSEAILFFLRCDHSDADVDEDIGTFDFIASGGYSLISMFKLFRIPIMVSFFDNQEAKRRAFVKQLHNTDKYYYVIDLGVDPIVQGQGLGSHLLGYLSALADKHNMPVYLESSSEGSRRLYERHGYIVRGIDYPPKDDDLAGIDPPPIYLMSRPPNSK